jgi:hypothetical protein
LVRIWGSLVKVAFHNPHCRLVLPQGIQRLGPGHVHQEGSLLPGRRRHRFRRDSYLNEVRSTHRRQGLERCLVS